jgi:hypothetical protein
MNLTVRRIEQALRSLLEWLKQPEATVPLSKRDRNYCCQVSWWQSHSIATRDASNSDTWVSGRVLSPMLLDPEICITSNMSPASHNLVELSQISLLCSGPALVV